MITKNTIYQSFKNFADNHLQIKDFGYGDLWEISASESTEYCLFWVSPQPCNVQGNEITYVYSILVADRVFKGEGNELEVESDTFQICLDFLAYLNDQSENEWMLNESVTITPFTERFKDEVTGHIMDINIVVEFDYNECAIPKIN